MRYQLELVLWRRPMIEIVCRSEPGTLVLEPVGALDAVAETMLQRCVDAAVEGDVTRLAVDLRRARLVPRSIHEALEACGRRLARRGVELEIRVEGGDRSAAAAPGTVRDRRVVARGGLAARDGGLSTSPTPRGPRPRSA